MRAKTMRNRRALLKTVPSSNRAYHSAPTADKIISKPFPANRTPGRWSCRHHFEGSEIAAYVAATGNIEVLARTEQSGGIDARANAEFIVQAINNQDKYWLLVTELTGALERCLKSGKPDWAAQQEAAIALKRARRVMGV
jgi:hypothetical protein